MKVLLVRNSGFSVVIKAITTLGMLGGLLACQHTAVEKRDEFVGPKWPYAWYWEAKQAGNGVVEKSVEAITFSGRDFVTIRHRPVPVEEPLPDDVVALADKYCGRLGKLSILRGITPRYFASAAFLCLTEEELENYVPLKSPQASS